MITLNFEVDSQVLKRMDRQILATNSVGNHKAVFSFTNDWDGITKSAVFTKGSESFTVALDGNDSCLVPSEVMQGDVNTSFEVSVYGEGVDSTLTSSIETVQLIRGAVHSS
jgi:hypothetical protein